MKFLFDLFPVILFFIAFKLWGIYVATGVAIAATFAQVGYLMARKRKVEPMLWMSLGIIVVFGGATLFLQDETFIKWKPSILYWAFAVAIGAALLVWKRNAIKLMLGGQVRMPEHAWNVLAWSWAGFFAFMGVLNLVVAYNFTTDQWVNFKLFGGTGLMLVFVVLQALYMSRYIQEDEKPTEESKP